MMSKILTGAMLIVLLVPSVSQIAFAQYIGDRMDVGSLYDWPVNPEEKKEIATQKGAFGSGTPYFAADGVIGSTILTAGVFGGIATIFFLKGRKGKYAAQGMG